uniref:Biphenyl dioxygenase ferredoxin reductase n=1 Tax=Pandoraea pnomenusa TaxID=93220 RepID=Q46377_9BURK|nr:biphenyl dioxygenase ferredoxin reductase [Pandoraea pnomenusa]
MGNEESIGSVLVVGGGLASVSFVNPLRGAGFSGDVRVIEAETEPAYDRPPLSKEFLRDGEPTNIRLDTSRAPGVEWLHGHSVSAIETARSVVRLSNGSELAYGTLVLATGARPPSCLLCAASGLQLFTLRTLDDAKQIRSTLKPGARLLVVGGGVIGLELAANARGLGCEVMIVEATDRLMNRCSPATLSNLMADCHRAHGIDLRLKTQVRDIRHGSVLLDDGTTFAADRMVIGIGVVAKQQLASAAGIAWHDGIFVDGFGRTTCPRVLAIADVTRQRNPVSGRFERIETWSNAQNQGAAVAGALVAESPLPYADPPWFWSDQFEMKIQVAGLATGDSRNHSRPSCRRWKVRADSGPQGRAVGVTCVNNAREFVSLKRLLTFDGLPDVSELANPTNDLRKLLQASA